MQYSYHVLPLFVMSLTVTNSLPSISGPNTWQNSTDQNATLPNIITHRNPSLQPNTFFTVPRIRQRTFIRNGTLAKSRVFHKLGWVANTPYISPLSFPPQTDTNSEFVAAATSTSTGSIRTNPEMYHAEYLTPITIGGQNLMVDFDTGSSDFWVFSSFSNGAESRGHTPFDPSLSASFQRVEGASFLIQYGDGSAARGVVGRDDVGVGDVVVRGQAVELATDVTDSFVRDVNNDGLVGFGFGAINLVKPTRQTTLFENLQPLLSSPVMTIDLREDGSGTYTFGSLGQATMPLTTIPLNTSIGLWQVQSPTYRIGTSAKLTNPFPHPAILDTGTSLMIVDDSVAGAYWSKVSSARYSNYYGGWTFRCDQAGSLPDFTVGIGDGGVFEVRIAGRMINYAPVDDLDCYGGVQSNDGLRLQVFGDLFFRNAVVVLKGDAVGGKASVRVGRKSRLSSGF